MAFHHTHARTDGLGVLALIAALIGLAFFWWVPFGIVLSIVGLVLGIVGWKRKFTMVNFFGKLSRADQ